MARKKLMLFFSILFALVMVTGIGAASAKKVLLKMQLIFPVGFSMGRLGLYQFGRYGKGQFGRRYHFQAL